MRVGTTLKQNWHEHVWIRYTISRILCGMAAIDQMQEAERKMRALLEKEGLPGPDEVEYEDDCVSFVWHEEKVVVQIEMD